MNIVTIVVASIFILIVIASIKSSKARRKFDSQYQEFLSENEGLEIFCYTNRLKFCSVIETELIPKLDENIHVIKLEGKEPKTSLDVRFISHALYNIKEVGFPNTMKIVNGTFIDYSLHKPVYDAINNNNLSILPTLVNEKLNKLRSVT
jgi:hypothetical protein